MVASWSIVRRMVGWHTRAFTILPTAQILAFMLDDPRDLE
jgi:hypothetical protein